MTVKNHPVAYVILATVLCLGGVTCRADKKPKPVDAGGKAGTPVLWREPSDLQSRNLYWGSGGEDHQPRGPYTFDKEDLEGTTPKFIVTDADGHKWKVKMAEEARPETAASRITWAAGYFTADYYFLREMQVQNMPERLKRGQGLVEGGGIVRNVRLKREEKKDQKKLGNWGWAANPFLGTRQFNGLKTLMATINNWDLKDINNAVYQQGDDQIYLISDLGASFGTPGPSWPHSKAKGNLHSFTESSFIKMMTKETVDFDIPGSPAWKLMANPKEYMKGVHLEWVCRDIPRADARWMGELLSQLSKDQLMDAFRAAGYEDEDAAGFTKVLQSRIQMLTRL